MEKQTRAQGINNAFYEELNEKWLWATDHPIALLRAENAVRIPWIIEQIPPRQSILDIGCGAGLLANALAKEGHTVQGIDLSPSSLKVAQQQDETKTVRYQVANAYCLPFPSETFNVVCAMDVLEHVEEPKLLLSEASRVLKPGGLFFFHTFNRNFLSYLLVIKAVEWFVPNAPKNMHVYPLFIKPDELAEFCSEQGLRVVKLQGFVPKVLSKATFKMLWTRQIPSEFTFRFSKSLSTGYCGYAKKN